GSGSGRCRGPWAEYKRKLILGKPRRRRYLLAVRLVDVLLTALGQIRANKLRSFFTLLGIIVSVGFLVAVIAIIQGMNAYVKENIADNVVGTNTFQVRRMPARVGLFGEDDSRVVLRRPTSTE